MGLLMTLINQVFSVCQSLSKKGWHEFLLETSGLNIRQSNEKDLAEELRRKLIIDRTVEGFEDFAAEGKQAIEPGKPAQSFLFHALAAPGLGARKVRSFPSSEQIEIIENYVLV